MVQLNNSFSTANDCCETDDKAVLFVDEWSERSKRVELNCDLIKSYASEKSLCGEFENLKMKDDKRKNNEEEYQKLDEEDKERVEKNEKEELKNLIMEVKIDKDKIIMDDKREKVNEKDSSSKKENKRKEVIKNVDTEVIREENKTEIKNKTFRIIRGSFHQANVEKFPEYSNGRQCTANAAVAIVKCSIKDPELWIGDDVDNVLMIGDEIYKESIETRPEVSMGEKNRMYLNAQEVQKKITIRASTRYIQLEPAELGHSMKTMYDCMNLEDRLQDFLKYDGSAILTSNSISIAIGKKNNKIWMFDSHARDKFGKLNRGQYYDDVEDYDAACLTLFPDVHSLLEVIRHNITYIHTNEDENNWFELHPVKVFILFRRDIIKMSNVSAQDIIQHQNRKILVTDNDSTINNYTNLQNKSFQNSEIFSKSSKTDICKDEDDDWKTTVRKQAIKGIGKVKNGEVMRQNKEMKMENGFNVLCDKDSFDDTFKNDSVNDYDNESSDDEYTHAYESERNGKFEEKDNDDCKNNLLNEEQEESSKKNGFKRIEEIDETEVLLYNMPTMWDKLTVRLATHTTPGCSITDIKLRNQRREGNRVCVSYGCKKCPWIAKIWTTDKSEEKLNINEALVLGSINSGTGYTQMKKLFTAAGIKCMNNETYRNYRNHAYKILMAAMTENMKNAGKEELRIATEKGNVINEKGLIFVMADGSWMKRSYRTGSYNFPAGLVHIIGYETGKILWLEVKNMYCSICDTAMRANKEPREYECYKNWNRSDSSTSMESIAIGEGFLKSEEEHNLIYSTLISEGDSSVYNRIRQLDPYAEYQIVVEKLECVKHLRRAFQNTIKTKAKSKPGYIGKSRKIFEESGPKCIDELNRLLKHYWDEDREYDHYMCEEVGKAIEILPRHVLGDHSECAGKYPLCDGVPKKNEQNHIPSLRQW